MITDSPTSQAVPFYVTGGTLPLDASSYVQRQADTDLLAGLLTGEVCYVLNARQMGKSSLCVRTMARLEEEGVRTVFLDLTKIGGQNLTPEQWYIGLLSETGRALELRKEFLQYWKENIEFSPVQRYFGALREVALERLDGQIVIFVDEIDVTRSLAFSTDEFFAALRQMYIGRAQDAVLHRLTFCLLGTAIPADLIRDTRTSPFNIGKRIEVRDFTPEEAQPLAAGLEGERGRGGEGENTLLARVLYWTGGHPYLTQRLCRAISESLTPNAQRLTPDLVDRLCTELFLTHRAKEADDNLSFVRNRLLKSEADLTSLLELYGKVRAGRRVPDDETNPLCDILRLSGVCRVENGLLKVRNRIYERVFDREWVRTHLPDAELRRQRAAFRRGLLRATAVASLIVAAMGGLAWKAMREAHRADALSRLYRSEADIARRRLYVADMNVAKQERDNNQTLTMVQLLKAYLPVPGQPDLRDFTWWHLWQLGNTHDEVFTLRTGSGNIDSSAFTPDGKFFATEQDDPGDHESNERVKLWDAATKRPVAVFKGYRPGETIENVTISPDGKWLAISGDEGAVLWELATRRKIAVFSTAHPAKWAAFAPNDKLLAVGEDAVTAQVWDIASRKEIAHFQDGSHSIIWGVAFSPDSRLLATASRNRTAKLWNIARRRQVAALRGHTSGVNAVVFSPDGKVVATASFDNTVKLWDAHTGQEIATLQGHTGALHALSFSPDGKLLATPSDDLTLRLWNVRERRLLRTLRGHTDSVMSAVFAPDGKILVSTGNDATVRFWDVETAVRQDTPETVTQQIRCLTPSAGNQVIAAGMADGTVRLADMSSGLFPLAFHPRRGNIRDIAIYPDDKTIATVHGSDTISLWDAWTGRELNTLTGAKGERFIALAISPDGRMLAAASQQGVTLWNTTTRRKLAFTPGYGSFGGNLEFTSDNRYLLIEGPALKIWNVSAGHEETAFGHDLKFATISPDGKLLATSGPLKVSYFSNGFSAFHNDHRIYLWDIAMKREVGVLPGPKDGPDAAAFSSDGKTLATGHGEGIVMLWDVASRREKATLVGHSQAVNSIDFAPDGRTLATGSDDGTVRLWYLPTDQKIAVMNEHIGKIMKVGFARDGSALFAWGQRGLRIWRAAKK